MSEVVSLINPQAEAAAAATLHPRRQTDDSSVGSDEHRRSSETANAISEGVMLAHGCAAASPSIAWLQLWACPCSQSHARLSCLPAPGLTGAGIPNDTRACLDHIQGIMPGLAA